MIKISQKNQDILSILLKKEKKSSSDIYVLLSEKKDKISLVTVKRILTEMKDLGLLEISGAGRSTAYSLSILGRVFADVDAREYCAVEPDQRYGLSVYNFNLFPNFPVSLLSEGELRQMEDATEEYRKRKQGQSEAIRKKELERLIIELSWKSSKIEGNTYTLLDTEKLILENKAATGKSREETQMILNHKDAFEFVLANSGRFKRINRALIEELHKIIVKGFGVGLNLRRKPVGVVGSIYRPLDNEYQISEAFDNLLPVLEKVETPYAKALLAKIGIAYIQPFEDGNKRTSRLMANGVLLAYGLAPLSYRSVDESEYREAMLVFYELNSIVPIKKIFISQYDFAARNYAV